MFLGLKRQRRQGERVGTAAEVRRDLQEQWVKMAWEPEGSRAALH